MQYKYTEISPNLYKREKVTSSNVRDIPGYALWTAEEMEDYINTNVTDLASAKVVMVGLAKMIAAIRDELWPNLTE